ncbi:MAG: enterochelin esterase [Deltaproteobacteria bacterium]|nr:enterochelin esterase [Deltaproteobacteria bacterium]
MPVHPWARPRGALTTFSIDSRELRGNLLQEPTVRDVAVYVPVEATDPVPVLYFLQGFTGSGLTFPAWKAFEESLPQRLDRLIATGAMPPVALVMPDGFTRLGGNQYVDNPVFGRWSSFLCDELVPAVEARYLVLRGRDHRGILGKSSGGYGAMWHGMTRADVWGCIASHSGDVDFDLLFRSQFVPALDRLSRALGRPLRTRADLDAATAAFLQGFYQSKKVEGGDLHHLMTLAMAATYDPRPDAPDGIRLPVDPWTATLDEEAWDRWLAWDPLRRIHVPETVAALQSLRGVFLDCGSRDPYALVYGTRALSAAFEECRVPHTFEEFDDDHSGIGYRFDVSLPWMADRLR